LWVDRDPDRGRGSNAWGARRESSGFTVCDFLVEVSERLRHPPRQVCKGSRRPRLLSSQLEFKKKNLENSGTNII
jgi:hypothetical protein